jgi:hypothetical protein
MVQAERQKGSVGIGGQIKIEIVALGLTNVDNTTF